VRFLLAWAAPSWLLFELVPTKLPHYVLPLYPALVVLAAMWALAPRDEHAPAWQKGLSYLALLQFAIGLVALVAVPVVLPGWYGPGTTWWLTAAAAAAFVLGVGALVGQFMRPSLAAAGMAMLAVVLVYPVIAAGVAPRLEQFWISQRAAALVTRDTRPGDPPPALAGYTEPSLVFLLGSETRLTNGAGAADVGASQGGLALVEDSERAAFLAHLAEVEADANRVDELSGFNYSRGRMVHITIYRVTATHDVTEPPAE
jgi:4-amino-4-deoxy-L-arabinose transferase-like glycosyltransferase